MKEKCAEVKKPVGARKTKKAFPFASDFHFHSCSRLQPRTKLKLIYSTGCFYMMMDKRVKQFQLPFFIVIPLTEPKLAKNRRNCSATNKKNYTKFS